MNHVAVLSAMVASCAQLPPGPILDVGSGSGEDAELLGRLMSREVLTVDVVPARNANHVVADAHDLPFASQSFSLVYASFLVHLVPDVRQVLAEMFRVVKAGGWIAIITLSHEQIRRRHLNRHFPSLEVQDIARYPSLESIERSIIHIGGTQVDSQSVTVEHAHPRPDFQRVLLSGGWSSLERLPIDERLAGRSSALKEIRQNPMIRWNEEKSVVTGRRPHS